MNILVVEPGKRPYAKEISGELESLQKGDSEKFMKYLAM